MRPRARVLRTTLALAGLVAVVLGLTVGPAARATEGSQTMAAGLAVVSASPQPFVLAESGGTVTATLRLRSRPTAPVEVRFVGDGQLRAMASAASIRPEQWSMGADVAFAAVDDGLVEGPHTGAVRLELRSQDPTYDGLDVAPVAAMLVDDDEAGVRFTPGADVRVGEGAGAEHVAVTLRAMPEAPVVVRFASDTQTTLDVHEMRFTPATWNVPQVLRIEAVDDAVHEESEHASVVEVTTTSTQASFDRLPVEPLRIRVFDDDRSAVLVDMPAPVRLDEAHPDVDVTGSVRLASRPAAPVTVVAVDLSGQLRLTNPRLTFTPETWNVPQSWRVAPVADDVAEPRPHVLTVQTRIESADPRYAALRRAPLVVQVADDDAPGTELRGGAGWPTIAGAPLRLDEGGMAARVEVVLASAPTAPLTVRPVVAPGAQLRVTPATYTFPVGTTRPAAVTFEVAPVDDRIDEEDPHPARIDWQVDTVDAAYLSTALPATDTLLRDDDVAGIDVTAAGPLALREGRGEELVSVVLRSQPTHDVVVTVEPDAQSTAVGLTRSLRFDAATWEQPQLLAVAAFDDQAAEPSPHPGRVALRVGSGDPRYRGLVVAPLELAITDDDAADVVATTTGTDTRVTEGGATDQVELRLGSRPTAPVTLTVPGDPQVVADPATVTIEPNAWDQGHPVTLTAVQDDVLEGASVAHPVVTARSQDAAYAGVTRALDVHVVDDELAGLQVRQGGDVTSVVEGGTEDSFTVALVARPNGDVTVEVEPDRQVDVAVRSLTFTAATWNQPQDVHVTAVQDVRDEPEFHPGVVSLVPRSRAPGWAGAAATSIGVRVADDDSSTVTFAATGGSTRVAEGGAGDTVILGLTSEPTGPVEVQVRSDGQTTSTGPVTIVPAAWQRPVTVRIDAVDDDDIEGEHRSSVEFVVRSTDAAYRRQSIPALDVVVLDDDEEGPMPEGDEADEDEDAGPVIPRSPVAAGVVGTRDGPGAGSATPRGTTVRGTAVRDHGAVSLPNATPGAAATGGAGGSRRDFDGTPTAARERGDDDEDGDGPSAMDTVGRWIGDHALLVGGLSGLLTVTGLGVGWIRLRDPMRGI